MCPKVFTGDCIINTVLKTDSLFIRIDGDLWGLKHCPAEAGQFRPVITGFRPSR